MGTWWTMLILTGAGAAALAHIVGLIVADAHARLRERREARGRWANGYVFFTSGGEERRPEHAELPHG
jgi:hypothetical protein